MAKQEKPIITKIDYNNASAANVTLNKDREPAHMQYALPDAANMLV